VKAIINLGRKQRCWIDPCIPDQASLGGILSDGGLLVFCG